MNINDVRFGEQVVVLESIGDDLYDYGIEAGMIGVITESYCKEPFIQFTDEKVTSDKRWAVEVEHLLLVNGGKSIMITKKEYEELLEYKAMYEDLCK